MALLHLQGALLAEVLVEGLAGAAERLPRAARPPGLSRSPWLAADALAAAGRRTSRDTWRCAAPGWTSVTVESCVCGPAPLIAGAHQDGAGQHAGRLEQQLLARHVAVSRRAASRPSSVTCRDDEAAIAALVVDVVRVPLAEAVVGPLVGGMAEVVAARIEGQLVEQGRIEVGVGEQRRVGGLEDLQGLARRGRWYVPAADAGAAQSTAGWAGRVSWS